MKLSVCHALLAAVLFGVSTPLAKLLVGEMPAILLGGLLYLGSGLGLSIVRLFRDRGWQASGLSWREWPWLLGAILFGGVIGPVLLLYGLLQINAATASLLLNLEGVITAVIAWVVFRENADWRVVAGMFCIVAGGVILSWPATGEVNANWLGCVFVALACCCWGIDNNLTRQVSANDALFIAAGKGLIAGSFNCLLALLLGYSLPNLPILLATTTLGLFGYGLSLVFFVLALRGLGAARTGAYFSTAPFIGALVAISLLGEPASNRFWLTAILMAMGVWLHLTERHEHEHVHETLAHRHRHRHDTHHQHQHDLNWDGREPHDHFHVHEALSHKHPHYPDIHHRHQDSNHS